MRLGDRLREIAANVDELEEPGQLAVACQKLRLGWSFVALDLEAVGAEVGKRCWRLQPGAVLASRIGAEEARLSGERGLLREAGEGGVR